jgi:sugar phosphate isomerase/epimerase
LQKNIQLAAMSLIWNNPAGERFLPWLEEVKAANYDGVTCFAHNIPDFLEQPFLLKRMLDETGLKLASVDVTYQDSLDYYHKVCELLATNQCSNMAYIDPKGGPKEFAKLGEQLNRVGEISLQYGVNTYYHNHTNGIGEKFEELERVHASVDPEKVFMMLDLGHATKDFIEFSEEERAIRFLEKYWKRIRFMEFKDWNETTDLNTPLGEGYCNYNKVFQLIQEKGYQGWITVEQNGNDGLSLGRTPFQCAQISRKFITDGLGL